MRPVSGRHRLPPINHTTKRQLPVAKTLRTKRGSASSLGLRLIGKRSQDFDILTLILRTPPTSARRTPSVRSASPKNTVTSPQDRKFDPGAVTLKLESLTSGVKLEKINKLEEVVGVKDTNWEDVEDVTTCINEDDTDDVTSDKIEEKRERMKAERLESSEVEELDEEQMKQRTMILTGSQSFEEIPPLPKKIVRIFVSSTFTGLRFSFFKVNKAIELHAHAYVLPITIRQPICLNKEVYIHKYI